MADESINTITETVEGQISLLDNKIYQKFLVLETLGQEMLLGMDALKRMNLDIRIFGKSLTKKSAPHQTKAYAIETPVGLAKLNKEQEKELQELIEEQKVRFEKIKGITPLIKHDIELLNDRPIKQKSRPRNPVMQKIIEEELDKMLAEGIVTPSKSPWSARVVIAKRKNGKPRFCIDYRALNDVSKKDAYPLPQVNATLDKLREAKYISSLDLKNGYWHVPLTERSKPLTAFTVPGRGLFEFKVMPFGLHSAPATFQRLIDSLITPDIAQYVFVYLDDIIIVTDSFEKHLEILREVLKRLINARLRPNWEKCVFARNALKYLGHIIDENGLRVDPEKVLAITSMEAPKDVKQLRRFLGLVSWTRRFIPNVASLSAPLNILLKKKQKWFWGEQQQEAFEEMKHRLTTAPTLACPDWEQKFILQTDASTVGLGAVLTQGEKENERVIAYASRSLNKAEKNYSATELECLAVKWGIWKMRDYLEGYHFRVITDHQSLKWLNSIDNPSGRLARWAMELSQHDFDIQYRKGSLNVPADTLSRQPIKICQINEIKCKWYKNMVKSVKREPVKYPMYNIINGHLYRHVLHTLDFNETDPSEDWKLCVPTEQRQRVLKECHDEPTSGHLGIAKTLTRLSRFYYWPGMQRDGTTHVRSCENCQRHKIEQRKPAGIMHATEAKSPWEIVSIDFVGPLPRSNDGNSQLVVLQDKFTKWIELRPLRKATARAVTRALHEQVVCPHGCPETVITDNGKQLVSKELSKYMEDAKIKVRRAPKYSAQCNPVERVNKVVKTMIKQYLKRSQRTWDNHISEIAYAYNTAKHDSTGYSPAYMNYGRELLPPGSLRQEVGNRPTSGLADRIKRLHDALEVARANMAQSFNKQRHYYNLRRRNWRPSLGDKVLRRNHKLSDKAKGYSAKLDSIYEESPYTVHKVISPVIFDLKDKNGKLVKHIHVQHLKPVSKQ